jgi:hypothetical protein
MRKIDIAKLPELKTRVGLYGSAKQQQVGGVFCADVFLAIVSG